MKYFVLILLLIQGPAIFSQPFSQSIEGTVRDAATGDGLAYVNIGVTAKAIGTVSDENGEFQLQSNQLEDEDSVRFSLIGYKSKILTISEIKSRENVEIILEPKSYELREIVVPPVDYKRRVAGNRTRSKVMKAGFSDNLLGYEAGVLMKIKNKPAFIKSASFTINQCDYDTIFYRLNVYKCKDGWPVENIMPEPLYIEIAREDLEETMTIDLSEYNLWVEDDFLVSLELVKDLGPGGLYFSVGMFNRPTVYRKTSQAEWEKFGFGIGVSTVILQEK